MCLFSLPSAHGRVRACVVHGVVHSAVARADVAACPLVVVAVRFSASCGRPG